MAWTKRRAERQHDGAMPKRPRVVPLVPPQHRDTPTVPNPRWQGTLLSASSKDWSHICSTVGCTPNAASTTPLPWPNAQVKMPPECSSCAVGCTKVSSHTVGYSSKSSGEVSVGGDCVSYPWKEKQRWHYPEGNGAGDGFRRREQRRPRHRKVAARYCKQDKAHRCPI